MNKVELTQSLEPFVDELRIVVYANGRHYEVTRSEYALTIDGEGLLVLVTGDRIPVRVSGEHR